MEHSLKRHFAPSFVTGFRAVSLSVSVCFSALIPSQSHAQGMSWGEEYARLTSASQSIEPVTDESFGDEVNLYDGSTSFRATDIAIRGNSGLPVELVRTRDAQNHGVTQQVAADWSIDVPNLSGTFVKGSGWQSQRCTSAAPPPGVSASAPPNYLALAPWQFWAGNRLSLTGAGDEMMLARADDIKVAVAAPGLGASSRWTTKSGWQFGCTSSVQRGSGEGFVGYSPDGKRYTFDWIIEEDLRPIAKRGVNRDFYFIVPRATVRIYATKVEDRFGNWVRYDWVGDRLQRIHSNDGREITLSYDADGRLKRASSGGRNWDYAYASYAIPQEDREYLQKVTLPDGSSWRYDASALVRRIVYQRGASDDPLRDAFDYRLRNNGYCNFDRVIQGGGGRYAVTHPGGATAVYEFSPIRHGRKSVPEACLDTQTLSGATNFYPLHHDVLSLTSKTISGAAVAPATFRYSYSGLDSGYFPTSDLQTNRTLNATAAPNYKTVIVAQPDGTEIVHVFGRDFLINEGRLLQTITRKGGVNYRVVQNEYLPENLANDQAFPARVGMSMAPGDNWLSSSAIRPIVKTTITQSGDVYTSEVPLCGLLSYCFDRFGRALRIAESNSVGYSRTRSVQYYDDYNYWVVGQVSRHAVIGADANGSRPAGEDYEIASVSFDHLARPVVFTEAGVASRSLTYNADGTISSVVDGRGLVTQLGGWKRGIPQSIIYADGRSESATVNDAGWVTSTTDENGFTTGFGYDAMGRTASIVYPGGEGESYHHTWIHFGPIEESDWKPAGVVAGQWRQVRGTGNHIAVTYMDAMWRPILVHEYDQTDVSSTLRASSREYDWDGRIVFQSFPSSLVVPPAQGVWSTFDPLGRLVSSAQDSEMGLLRTHTEYLTGLRTRITNPRGQQVDIRYMAWEAPSLDRPVLIVQPEGKVVEISRHASTGQPRTIVQRSASGLRSVPRTVVYDQHARVCKMIEPESGVTVFDYDAAGNIVSSAGGLDAVAFSSTNDCQRSAALLTGRAVTRTYDSRNRMTRLSFPDGRGDQVWQYTPDGLPAAITTTNDAGHSGKVVNTYTYNRRRLLESESSSQPGWYSWSIGYRYDANGHLASQSYPTGLIVDFGPNALGQATKAGTFATNARYFPNGALKEFTYGNGVRFSAELNARQLPSRLKHGAIADMSFNYDENGNVTNIWDLARGDNFSKWLQYDNLDRLVAVGSGHFGGDAWHRVSYDEIDNITSWKIAGVKDYAAYSYDDRNRLTNIRDSSGATVVGFGYDLNGNVVNKNGQLYDFDYGNRLRSVTGKESYRYDGLGRRVQSTSSDGRTTLWQYDREGQMLFSSDWTGAGYANQQTHESVYLAGRLITVVDHSWPSNAVIAVRFQHFDTTGNVIAVTDASGSVLERLDYEPWGALVARSGRSGAAFGGHVSDGGTALTYMQQRYYDPSIGRFLSVDPMPVNLVAAWNFNRYAYAANSPYKFRDPDGRAIETGWDVLNVTMDVTSLVGNVAAGNWGGAAVDLISLTYDGAATVIPGLPAGGGVALKIGRGLDAVYSVVKRYGGGYVQMDAISSAFYRLARAGGDLAVTTRKGASHALDVSMKLDPQDALSALRQAGFRVDPNAGRGVAIVLKHSRSGVEVSLYQRNSTGLAGIQITYKSKVVVKISLVPTGK